MGTLFYAYGTVILVVHWRDSPEYLVKKKYCKAELRNDADSYSVDLWKGELCYVKTLSEMPVEFFLTLQKVKKGEVVPFSKVLTTSEILDNQCHKNISAMS